VAASPAAAMDCSFLIEKKKRGREGVHLQVFFEDLLIIGNCEEVVFALIRYLLGCLGSMHCWIDTTHGAHRARLPKSGGAGCHGGL